MKKFPFYRQLDQMDCGPTCLKIIAKFYGKEYSIEYLRRISHITKGGVSYLGLSEAAEGIGLRTLVANVDFKTLLEDVPLPCIAHWRQKHFIVIYKTDAGHVYVSNPSVGLLTYTHEKFLKGWLHNNNDKE